MVKKVFNWSFGDVDKLLREHGFQVNRTTGSHYFYQGSVGGILRIVCVPFHGNKTLKPRTLKGIISQSGLSKTEWLDN